MKSSKNEKKNTTGGKGKGCWDDEDESTNKTTNEIKKNPWEKPTNQISNEPTNQINTGKINSNNGQTVNNPIKKETSDDKKNTFTQM